MVATPRFHVTQDASRVFVHVHVPFVRVSEMEFYVDGLDFTFFCKPFLLKLHFPHEVVDDELAKAVYDPNKVGNCPSGFFVRLCCCVLSFRVNGKRIELQWVPTDVMCYWVLMLVGKWHHRGASAQEGARSGFPGSRYAHEATAATATSSGREETDPAVSGWLKAPLIEVLTSSTPAPIGDLREESERLNDLLNGTAPRSSRVQADTSLLGLEATSPAQSVGLAKLEPTGAQQEAVQSIDVRITDLQPSYGFNNAYSDFFRVWHGEVSEILSLPDPEHIQPDQRRVLREAAEEQQFDIERYLLDFVNTENDMYFELAMEFEPFWTQFPALSSTATSTKEESDAKKTRPVIQEVKAAGVDAVGEGLHALKLDTGATQPPPVPSTAPIPSDSGVAFTEAEQELLLRLPRKEFLLSDGSNEEKLVIGGLVDILIGFAYEQLTNQGDSGVESTWTVSILSPTLSWLDPCADLRAVVRSAVRRVLTFPFLRQYDLALRCVREASEILKRGKRVVLRALLTLYRIVEKSETQYLLNALYIQDYCVWIQSVADERLQLVSLELDAHLAAFTKAETGWALEELERSLLESDAEEEEDGSLSSSSKSSDGSSSDEESSDEESSDEEDEAPKTVESKAEVS
ncbi:hypothetical protein BBJ28_00021937 [Nothophytophthora sp. Chile5]|nr:hypothetical protein BBJ28_00021937 [Nothophytophthora sp. Chile5]